MPGRVIEILSPGTCLSKDRGFIRIEKRRDRVDSHIPIDSVSVLIAGKGVSISSNLLLALAGAGASVVVTGSTYHPAGFFWPQSGHTQHVRRLNAQIAAAPSLKKRLWQQVVRLKISQQGDILYHQKGRDEGIKAISARVRSGDPDNLEAQAARRYWQALFGKEFRRKTIPAGTEDPNSPLNYGYAILRAAMARAVSACGLTPALGIHHSNLENPFCLVDDLMEPYRPLVDNLIASRIKDDQSLRLSPETKRALAGLLDIDLLNHNGDDSPVSVTMLHVTQSFCDVLESSRKRLAYPKSITHFL
ncbi:MAG: type II CRISPR-associated endonuclease Cas1 [Alphaproteobacteria bacterium]|nr:type II CRISPR-associated endonuclease Cas1 [Alphaproteobacteria bacterium]